MIWRRVSWPFRVIRLGSNLVNWLVLLPAVGELAEVFGWPTQSAPSLSQLVYSEQSLPVPHRAGWMGSWARSFDLDVPTLTPD